jgi:Trk K+ transport system NAD-binding subunit
MPGWRAADHGVTLTVLDFLIPGLGVAVMVVIALVLFSPRLLKQPSPQTSDIQTFFVEARVSDDGVIDGKTVGAAKLRGLTSFFLAEIVRGERVLAPVSPHTILRSGDRLIFVGDVRFLDELRAIDGVMIATDKTKTRQDNTYQAVVAPDSPLAGKTLKATQFRARFDASVLAIKRGEEKLSGKLGELPLKAGDLLILAAGPDFPSRDNIRPNLYLLDVNNPAGGRLDRWKTAGLIAGFTGFVMAALFQLVPLALAAMVLVGVSILLDWISPREARRIFPFDVVIVLWGAILLGELVGQSGIASYLGNMIGVLSTGTAPIFAIASVFLVTWLLTEFFSNASAALIGLPIALATSAATGISADALALTAAFGASACFLMPFGYQTHLIVMSSGGYRGTNFLRLGSAILAVYSVTAISLIALTQL